MSYIDQQLLKVCPIPAEQVSVKLKLHSEQGETNWLNISAETFHQIELLIEKDYKK